MTPDRGPSLNRLAGFGYRTGGRCPLAIYGVQVTERNTGVDRGDQGAAVFSRAVF